MSWRRSYPERGCSSIRHHYLNHLGGGGSSLRGWAGRGVAGEDRGGLKGERGGGGTLLYFYSSVYSVIFSEDSCHRAATYILYISRGVVD